MFAYSCEAGILYEMLSLSNKRDWVERSLLERSWLSSIVDDCCDPLLRVERMCGLDILWVMIIYKQTFGQEIGKIQELSIRIFIVFTFIIQIKISISLKTEFNKDD